MKFLLVVGGIALSLLVLAVFGSGSASAQACGPGDHWIDTCPAGTDSIPQSGALLGIDLDGDCKKDQNIILNGSVNQITRSGPKDDSDDFPTFRSVDGHSDVIDTEILSMELTGSGLVLRVGTATPGINPSVPPTKGAIGEQPGDPALAESFFDVWFEVDDGGALGGPFYNHSALRIEAEIDQVPPKAVYLHPSPLCLDLFDAPVGGNDTGINLVEASHNTAPSVGGTVELLAGGDSDTPASAGSSGSSTPLYGALAGGLALGAVALTAGGWYARRRWPR